MMNESTKYFMNFFVQRSNRDFLPEGSSEYTRSICRTDFQSEVLYILPATHDLRNLRNYDNLKYVTINNYKIGQKEFDALRENQTKLENVEFLKIWNIKQNDLDLLKFFPSVTHIEISYISKESFSYEGFNYLEKLNTLCLSSVNKITDFNFLSKSQKQKIKHLNLIYTAKLTKLDGIEDFENLETLSLFASTPESRKTVVLESLDGIEKLSCLRFFEIGFFNFNLDELKDKLKNIRNLKEYQINNKTYYNHCPE